MCRKRFFLHVAFTSEVREQCGIDGHREPQRSGWEHEGQVNLEAV